MTALHFFKSIFRFKSAFFSGEESISIKELLIRSSERTDSNEQETENQVNVNLATSKDEENDIWNYIDTVISSSQLSHGIESELENYLKEPNVSRISKPLEWWGLNRNKYPMLSSFVPKYLCAMSSSVYSERLFSEAGNIYENKRNRILPVRCEKLLFIHHNYKYCKK